MNIRQLVGIIVILAAIIGGGVYLSKKSSSGQPTTQNQPALSTNKQQTTVSYRGESGKNALELLKAKYTTETSTSSFGEMVTSIAGKKADSQKEFWAFYVNGQMAQVGAGSYTTKSEDKIEWKLESLK